MIFTKLRLGCILLVAIVKNINMKKENSMKEEIYVNHDFETLLSHLFGKNYHGDSGSLTISDWKKRLIKIINSIEKGIKYNVNSDTFHKDKLNLFCETAKDEINKSISINQINTDTIRCLVRIIFYLLGDMPDNWNLKITNKLHHWKLDENRTLYYTQSPTQKVNLILNISRNSNYNNILPEYSELSKKRFDEFQKNDIKFMEWFKETYPAVYMEIF